MANDPKSPSATIKVPVNNMAKVLGVPAKNLRDVLGMKPSGPPKDDSKKE
jgi:hypothetical protein